MVIVRLIGGLGNQLFQYALGRRLALLRGVPLKLDVSPFREYTLHKYSLQPFNIIEDFATEADIAAIEGTAGIARLLRRGVDILRFYYRRYHVYEQYVFHYDPNIMNVPKNVYLQGYWQSERYFKDIEEVIRSEFTVKVPPDPESRRVAEEIAAVNAVSLHIRRGDYVTTPDIVTCPLEYYHHGAEIIGRSVARPHFFVFSDDPGWTRSNLALRYPVTFVTHNKADRNYEDLRLMTLCKHHIIANSTFSWWGAWLGENPDKIVCAPSKWFKDFNADASDLIPASWIIL